MRQRILYLKDESLNVAFVEKEIKTQYILNNKEKVKKDFAWEYPTFKHPPALLLDIPEELNINKTYSTNYKLSWIYLHYATTNYSVDELKEHGINRRHISKIEARKLNKKEIMCKLWLKENFYKRKIKNKILRDKFSISKPTARKYLKDLELYKTTDERHNYIKKNYILPNFDIKKTSILYNVSVSTIEREVRELEKEELHLKAKNWIKENFRESTISIKELAKQLGISEYIFREIRDDLGIERKHHPNRSIKAIEWMKENYEGSDLTDREIAEIIKVDERTVKKYKKDIDAFKLTPQQLANKLKLSSVGLDYLLEKNNLDFKNIYTLAREWVRENYKISGKTDEEIAKDFNISKYSIAKYRKEFNYKKNKKIKLNKTEIWLLDHFNNWKGTLEDLAFKLNTPTSNLHYYIKKHNLKSTSKYDRAKEWLKANYKDSLLSNNAIAKKLGVCNKTLRKYKKELGLTQKKKKKRLHLINEQPCKLFHLSGGVLATSHYKKYYPKLYRFLREDYCGNFKIKQISHIFNIDIDFLKKMMKDLNVNNYKKYKLSSKQIYWIKNTYMNNFISIKEIRNMDIFSKNEIKEFKKFIKKKN